MLVTFALITYNQERYILEAIESALRQTYTPLEILIADDCSTDNTLRIITETVGRYKGPHSIIVSRNKRNIGVSSQINKINSESRGELIVVAAGDDISIPERTSKLVDAYLSSNKTYNYLYSSAQQIDLEGKTRSVVNSPGSRNSNNLLKAALSPYPLAIGATQAWTKTLSRSFPPLNSGVWAEDQVLGLRGLLLGPVHNVATPLVYYRIGSGVSTNNRKFTVAKYFKGKISGIEIYRQRCIDAWTIRRYLISIAIAIKLAMLVMILPIDPIVSLIKKIRI